jgi:hypothetical protein
MRNLPLSRGIGKGQSVIVPEDFPERPLERLLEGPMDVERVPSRRDEAEPRAAALAEAGVAPG